MTSLLSVKSFAAAAVFCTVAAAASSPIDAIVVSGVPSIQEVKVLLINAAGEGCRDTLAINGSDPDAFTVAAEQRLVGVAASGKAFRMNVASRIQSGCWCQDDNAGFAVLAPDRAVAYFSASPLPGRGYERAKFHRLCPERLSASAPPVEFAVRMRKRREVPIAVWTPEKTWMESMARDDIANADWIYSNELAGVTFSATYENVPRAALPVCDPAESEDLCCLRAVQSPAFDPNSLNLYFGNGVSKFACRAFPVVFIDDSPVLGDSAHELGHALGLRHTDNDRAIKPSRGREAYPQGHTQDRGELFGVDNIMWQRTHFLKHRLSPGQAFWISQSCESFLNQGGACARCGKDPNSPSPCPPFQAGLGGPPSTGLTVELDPAKWIMSRHLEKDPEKKPKTCSPPRTTYPSGKAIELAIEQRYELLNKHVKGRPGLELGAAGKFDFKDHWTRFMAIPLHNVNPADKKSMSDSVPGNIRWEVGLGLAVEKFFAGNGGPVPPCGVN